MGNICGKQDPEDRLGPGRPLGSAPPRPHKASVPQAKTKQTYQSEARVVGGGSSGGATPASQAARERWSTIEEDRKKQEAQRKKKLGGARVLTAKERDEQDRRRSEIEANDRQVLGQTG
ncbi:hypothetical protein CCM_05903 [Cordyceps militaris CM01]|uniref:Uncharacterized protein n=2 Tax=Cordyceps militaris TaxID=73501 RepID=G3JHN9_CORMM|nr:uncharacterized protein CCM_05903 [Cordyceps militaris CM01]ATY58792.1 hypothetical protein A9K55_003271 [Cordyceps militaris]EGX91745.1 hypothetical protein CCM_05903 [Cordyceps militaris CM01]